MLDEQVQVVLMCEREDQLAYAKIVRELEAALGEHGVVERVDGPIAPIQIEHYVRRGLVTVICASDAATAATLIWELADPQMRDAYRVLVVLGDASRVETLPRRLREVFEILALGERGIDGVLSRIERLVEAPRAVDLLASVYRSAIARRSPDLLLAIGTTLGPVVEIDARSLAITARVGDEGPRPNPLWSHWVGHGRTLKLAASSPSSKTLPPNRKQ